MKSSINFFFVVLLGASIALSVSCKKEAVLATVVTNDITDIVSSSARVNAEVTADGDGTISERGICYSIGNTSPTISDSKTSDGMSIGTYTGMLSGLLPNTKYYVRAFVTNEVGTAYGAAKEFTTNM